MIKAKNKYYVREHLESALAQIAFFYVANKANRKKIQEYFNSMSFFFFDNETQNILYNAIQNAQVSSYIDSHGSIKILCHNIYSDFCTNYNISYKSYSEFYEGFEFKTYNEQFYIHKEKQAHIRSYILSLLIISLTVVYFCFFTHLNIKPLFKSETIY